MAFLEVLTRCYKRPKMLKHNQASLEAQTCDDWQQTLIVDEIGQGIGWAQLQLAEYAPELEGDYIWILDDDDMCRRNTFVAELKHIVEVRNPDVIMVRMNHGMRGILPDNHNWRGKPVVGRLGCSAYVIRREVWQKYAPAFATAHYASDFDFIAAVFEDDDIEVYWHDVIASQVQHISMGEPE